MQVLFDAMDKIVGQLLEFSANELAVLFDLFGVIGRSFFSKTSFSFSSRKSYHHLGWIYILWK